VKRKDWLVGCVLMLVMAVTAAAGFVICPKCGYENADTVRRCTHCAAALPRVEETGRAEAAADADRNPVLQTGEADFIEATVVNEEMDLAAELMRKGDAEVAKRFLMNAAALNTLTDPVLDTNRGARVLTMLEAVDKSTQNARQPCHVCRGTGRKMMEVQPLLSTDQRSKAYQAEVEVRAVPGTVCTNCRGKGYVLRPRSMSELRYSSGRALARYTVHQRSRRFVPVGNAWVPAALVSDLTPIQRARLMRSTASPCEECLGFGRVDCEECNGKGLMPCPNRDCENGTVEVEQEGRLVRQTLKKREPCAVCNGSGFVDCAECRGLGSVVCDACGGTGQREACRSCSGQGVETCSRCKGAGRDGDGPCPECGETGMVLCHTCGGDGRKR